MWVKLDDGFWIDDKVIAVGNTAAGIFARLLSFCGYQLTDGAVPPEIVALIAGPEGEEHLDALDRMGMTERTESGLVVIPKFLEFNFSKAEAKARQESKSEAARAAAEKRWARTGRSPRRSAAG